MILPGEVAERFTFSFDYLAGDYFLDDIFDIISIINFTPPSRLAI